VQKAAITKRLTGAPECASFCLIGVRGLTIMPKYRPNMLFFFGFLVAFLAVTATSSPSGAANSSSQELAAQRRPQIVIHPRRFYLGPNAKRYCRSWLQVQHRLSGTVIVPQRVCWWG
jgi:hypothetical protein